MRYNDLWSLSVVSFAASAGHSPNENEHRGSRSGSECRDRETGNDKEVAMTQTGNDDAAQVGQQQAEVTIGNSV
jgi:hypothetical protein